MKILQITSSMDDRGGGPPEAIRQHMTARAANGIETTLVSLDPVDADFGLAKNNFIPLGCGIGKYRFAPSAQRRIAQIAATHDIAIIDGLWQHHAQAAWAALAGRLPYVVYPHGMLDPWFNRTYPLKALKKRLYWRLIGHRIIRDAAAVCFTTETERILARTSFRPYTARELVVGYGTTRPPASNEISQAAFLRRCPAAIGRRMLLFLSRIHRKKGCDILIDAFAKIAPANPELVLVVAGPDEDGMIPALRRQAAARGVADRVLWPGMLRGDEKWGAFHAAEAFVLPSHQENFGIAVTEALGCGLPVLISDQVNIWREITDDHAGIADADTTDGCYRTLVTWLAMAEEERRKMRSSAASCFLRRYDITAVAVRQSIDLGSIIAGERRPAFKAK